MTRRIFLSRLTTALAAPACLSAATNSKRLPIAFSTLGCPRWNWSTVLARAREWGYAAVELRGLEGEMDLTKRPEFTETRLATSLKDVEAAELKISDLGSSVRLHEADPATRAAQLDEGRRYIDLAHRLKAPYIRVFGDRVVAGQPKQATIDRIIGGLQELGTHAKESGVTVLIESHGDFCDSPTLLKILKGADSSNVALLWDAHHTVVAGKEKPEQTLRDLGRYLRHVHLKDSKPEGKDVRYVLTGEGTVPVRETVSSLVRQGYKGYYSYEWEKVWHPEIADPEVAFPHFVKVMGEYLRES
jgi:sugar phosphate isomerase/epimerase